MRKLILKMSVSADGFVGGPNGEIDWILRTLDESATRWIVETLWQAGVHIMGSRTYHDMASYWPTSTEPFAAPMNEIPKVVFSRRLATAFSEGTRALKDATRVRTEQGLAPSTSPAAATWSDPTFANGDLAEEIARLKRQPGKPILAHGGAAFARSLVKRGLVDEYQLLVHPVALGRGLPLFSDLSKPLDLQLVGAAPFRGGVVAHVYRISNT
jgi:dihydrofolate reductase